MAPKGTDIGIHTRPEWFRAGWAVAFYTRSGGAHRFHPSPSTQDAEDYRNGIEAGLVLDDGARPELSAVRAGGIAYSGSN
jgi:hypothetical protein